MLQVHVCLYVYTYGYYNASNLNQQQNMNKIEKNQSSNAIKESQKNALLYKKWKREQLLAKYLDKVVQKYIQFF